MPGPPREWMCARRGCARAGEPTTDRRCEVCGFPTVQYNEAESSRLRAAPAGSSTVESPAGSSGRGAGEGAPRPGIPVSTANWLPGWEVTEYLGEVFGLIVRSRGAFPQFGAQLKSIVGGELQTMTNLLRQTRGEAIERLVEVAERRGADAVIAMRFDVTTMAGDWTEVCAYGTAVRAHRLGDAGAGETP